MDSRTKNSARNIVAGFVSRGVSVLMPFITRTVLISTLGMSYVGLNSLFASILGVLNLAELGVGTALVFSMYEPFERGDTEKICALLLLYKRCYRIIGCAVLGAGLVLLPFLRHLVHGDLPDGISLYALYGIHLANAVLGYFLFAYKQSLFIASQRNDVVSNVGAALAFASSALQITLLVTFQNFYLYALVLPAITIANNICISYLAKRKFPDIASRGIVDKDTRASIKKNVMGLMVQKLGVAMLTSVDGLIISAFLGVELLGIYNNYYLIVTSLIGFLSVIQVGMTASVGNSLVSKSIEENYWDFRKFNFISIWVITWWTACYVCLIQPFITLWLGSDALLPLTVAALLGAYFYSKTMSTMVVVYREASGLWKEGMFVPLIAAVVLALLNIAFIRPLGIAGPPLSTVICMFMVYLPFYSIVLFRHYFKDLSRWRSYLCSQLLHAGVAAFISVVTLALCSFIPDGGMFPFIVKLVIAAIVPNVLLFVLFGRTGSFLRSREFVIAHFISRNGGKHE